ncbi:septum formation initiator family protein [Gammaproteobacteria bacterium]|nr:septum formation initiator family protein [Gammaproteobacteria bacterium]
MSLIKILTCLLIFLIAVTVYSLYFGADSKASFTALQNENKLLSDANDALETENNFLESAIKSKQQNDLYAEKFAREELNLILPGEEFISFQETDADEPQH